MKISQFITYCLSIPKTIYFNFKCLSFNEAIRIPIFISYKVELKKIKRNVIKIDSDCISTLMIKIGFNGTEEIAPKRSMINMEDGKILFKGTCAIAEGCTIGVSNGGVIEFGDNFTANKNFFISCNEHTIFLDDVMLGWNVTVYDANGHPVYKNNVKVPPFKPIKVGKHVWICSEVHILKGSEVPDGSIVAYGALVSKSFKDQNSLYGGVPAKKTQDCICWKRSNT